MNDPVDPAAVTSSFLMDDWTDDEVLALSIAGHTGGIDDANKAFAKARDNHMLDLGATGWKVRDSATTAADWQLERRATSTSEREPNHA